jgi:hypothetical protein
MQFLGTAVVAVVMATNARAVSVGGPTTEELMALRLSVNDSHSHRPLAPRAGFHLRLPRPQTFLTKPDKVSLSVRPTPNIDIGFRDMGKAWGAGVQLVSDSGVKLGVGVYLAKVGIGMPMDRQLMLVLSVPLW